MRSINRYIICALRRKNFKMKKLFRLIVSVMFISAFIAISFSFSYAEDISDEGGITYQEWESNMNWSNEIIEHFLEYYGESTAAGVQFPSYYAGFEIKNDGTLVLHSTLTYVSGMTQVISVPAIKSEYSHYVYLNSTSYSQEVQASS